MKRYKNVLILGLMLVMAIFVAGAISAISNGVIEEDNREIAAQTCGVTVQIMSASEESFLLNMVNSAQYRVDCFNADFVLQKKDEDGEWKDVPVRAAESPAFDYDLPSGENRSFVFEPIDENGNTVLAEGEYRLRKDIHREVGSDNATYADLTLTAEFSYPEIVSEKRSFDKAVDDALTAAKLARTSLPEQEGMKDYWNPEVEETDTAEGLTDVEEADSWWKVTFAAEEAGAQVSGWVMYVAKEDGRVYGPVLLEQ